MTMSKIRIHNISLTKRENLLLELKNITKTYQSPSGSETRTVLHNLSLEVNAGESIAILGPSGSGKSTLLNIIGSLDKPTSGEVILDGQNLSELDDIELAKIRNKKIGFIFQLHHLLPQCTVLENILIPTLADRSQTKKVDYEQRARDLLKRVNLENHTDHRPAQLSGGEQQRVAVIRAMIQHPPLLLADEPTGSLDQKSADNLAQILMALNSDENITLIVVTHSSKLAGYMDQIYSLDDGRLEVRSK
jgi:ABC-type lipoprotein export system ATPase subunit